jgi:hypothetical protein
MITALVNIKKDRTLKKIMIYLMVVLAIALATAGRASASVPYKTHQVNTTGKVEPFEGEFSGYVYADRGSKTGIILEMSQLDKDVSALVRLEEGLYIDAGICGSSFIPAGEQTAHATVQANNPGLMSTNLVFTVKNLKVSVDLTGKISADGKSIDTKAIIDLPWLCGRDPVIQGTLYKVQ